MFRCINKECMEEVRHFGSRAEFVEHTMGHKRWPCFVRKEKCCSTFKKREIATKHLYSVHGKLTIDCHPMFIQRKAKTTKKPRLVADWLELQQNVKIFLKRERGEEVPTENSEKVEQIVKDANDPQTNVLPADARCRIFLPF